MKINAFGNKDNKAIILIHGGGLSNWSIMPQITELSQNNNYYVIAPIIDGHGDDYENTFVSIEDTANKIVEYINTELDGSVFAIWGLSIGGQIAVQVLSENPDIAEYAILESALVYPMKQTAKMAKATYDMMYGFIKKRWFSRLQAKSLYLPENMFDNYFNDIAKMSKETLINMTISNSTYTIPQGLSTSNAKSLVLVGGKELRIIKKSAYLINQTIKSSTLMTLENNGHGQMCLTEPAYHTALINKFISGNLMSANK